MERMSEVLRFSLLDPCLSEEHAFQSRFEQYSRPTTSCRSPTSHSSCAETSRSCTPRWSTISRPTLCPCEPRKYRIGLSGSSHSSPGPRWTTAFNTHSPHRRTGARRTIKHSVCIHPLLGGTWVGCGPRTGQDPTMPSACRPPSHVSLAVLAKHSASCARSHHSAESHACAAAEPSQ
jgi:hypothetical protein